MRESTGGDRAACGADPRGQATTSFARGFVAMLPLWAGALPIGAAYGVGARDAGLGPGEAQLMSLLVFSAAAQVSVVTLLAADAPGLVLVGTALALSVHFPLLGLEIGRRLRLSWPARLAVAWFLTDGAYGVAAGRGPLRLPVLLGAGVSMYGAWNIGTGLGIVAGQVLPDPRQLDLDVVVPLTFLAVLVPLLRTRTAALVALVAGAAALALTFVAPGGPALLGGGLAGGAVGAWRMRPAALGIAGDDAGDRAGGES